MKKLILLLFVGILLSFQTQSDNPNPIFNDFNQPIDFASISADDIEKALTSVKEDTEKAIALIVEIPANQKTFENTFIAIDDGGANLGDVYTIFQLLSSTHADSLIRNTALEAKVSLGQYWNEVSLNEDLYKAAKTYAETDAAKSLEGYKAKFVKETIEGYERNGFALSAEKRDELKAINDEIAVFGNKFNQNIGTFSDHLIVSEEEIDGLPDDYKKARKQEDGTYKIDMSYPSVFPFYKLSNSDSARQKLQMKFSNRAYPDNMEVLQDLLRKRLEMAQLLGHKTYAAYNLEDRMAKNPETVWEFEKSLTNAIKDKYKKDYDELLEVKRTKVKDADVINGWETSYYSNILKKEKYQLDGEEVKQYFALDDVLAGLFSITQTLFNFEYREVKDPSVWNDEVRMFELYQDGKLKGRFYLDLFPRENKYGHAACFPIRTGKMTAEGYKIPTASLVCNFPRPTEDKPSLMSHSQVNTFFHEFGHVLHHMATTAELDSQAGTNVSRDFVEAPSQIFENWVWNYDALKLFAKHYETGEVLPKSLFDKMLAAKNVGSGMSAAGQVFYGSYDMTLHDKYDPNGDVTTTDVAKKLQAEISLIPWVEGTHFQAAFGHLNGYGASYYGYLWSKVYAQDMFSVFEENGILDTATGIRYRDIILAPGKSRDELGLVKEFLGRDPNNKAFLRELGL